MTRVEKQRRAKKISQRLEYQRNKRILEMERRTRQVMAQKPA